VADPKLDSLKRVSLFAQCSDRELRFIASQMDEVDIKAGRELTHQGRPGDAFYVLLEGEVEVSVDQHPRHTMGPGDFFGEISMVDRGPATATVVTKAPVRAMVMSHAQFRDAVKSNDELFGQVMIAMAMHLRRDALAREAGGSAG
jgi:CRP-like cAMP-binding protein